MLNVRTALSNECQEQRRGSLSSIWREAYGELGQVTLSVELEGFQPRLTGA